MTNIARRFQIRFDNAAGINGVYDTETGKFVGHTQTEAGCRLLRRNIARRLGVTN
jgi:hypothetical protein